MKILLAKEEENDFYSDDDLFKISSWGADLSFRELIDRYQDNELVKPEIQRKYVWDKTEASRFIDSLLLGLPVPSIFLAKTQDEKLLIIDGFQRIMTVFDFVRGVFSTDQSAFKLSRSEKINSRWRGKSFVELSDAEQRKIRNTTIHAIIFVQQHPSENDTSYYQVFERINTSGRTLMPQEIRNCIYQGPLNDLLFALNKVEPWRSLYGNKDEDSRMRDIELILRFFALSSPEFYQLEQEGLSLKKFLNQIMGKYSKLDERAIAIHKRRFENSVSFIYKQFHDTAFRNLSGTMVGKFSPNFSPTIFDSMMIATDELLISGHEFNLSNLQSNRLRLLQDEEYKSFISKETMRKDSILKRVEKVKSILYEVD